ncbi:hypothetical protein KGQ64_04445 [bacterium]|nr:hypothetical protein [bacterium]
MLLDPVRDTGLGFEWFVARLPDDELQALVRDELGCHVALRLRAGIDPEATRSIAVRASGSGDARAVTPVHTNPEIGVRLVYVDGADEDGRVRRLEPVSEG